MRKSRFSEEQMVALVRESHAHGVAATAKKHRVSEHSIYTWRRKFGEMNPNQVAELKRITPENARLKKQLALRDLEIASEEGDQGKKSGRRPIARPGRGVRPEASGAWTLPRIDS